MASRVRWIDFDCTNPYLVASFWAEATGLRHHPSTKPGEEECALLSGADIIKGGMLFQRVPEGKRDEPRTDVGFPVVAGPTSIE
jgi:Glyoxalase-like domain